jgi:UbiD family decarboxylase
VSTEGGFRRFIGLLEESGELTRVHDGVHWKFEIGERTRAEAAGPNRAVLFENVREYEGARVLTNAVGSPSRMGIALGLAAKRSFREVRRAVRERVAHPVEPELVEASPVEHVTQTGDALDLTTLPVPWWSREDGGRYLGTWHLNITRDPETGERNVGVYRMQLSGPRTALVSASAGSHLKAQLRRAEALDRPLEMAVAIGVPESQVIAAGMAVAPGMDELSLAGALTGEPVRLRPCESIGLEVPADAEIVVEGHVRPGARAGEGPFVDYAGVASANPGALVFDASLLSRRDDAIFRGAAIGRPRAEDHLVYAVLASAGCLDFHGSRARHHLQKMCLKAGWYRLFQALGRPLPRVVAERVQRRRVGSVA